MRFPCHRCGGSGRDPYAGDCERWKGSGYTRPRGVPGVTPAAQIDHVPVPLSSLTVTERNWRELAAKVHRPAELDPEIAELRRAA